MQRAGASHAAHDFVQDELDAVAIAQFAHAVQVAGNRGQHAGRRATDGFRDEGDDGFRPQPGEGVGQFGHQALAILLG